MNELLKLMMEKKGTAAYRAILVALILFLVFKKDFVTVEDYKADKAKQAELNDKVSIALENINRTLIMTAAQDGTLKDHETRIRALERGWTK